MNLNLEANVTDTTTATGTATRAEDDNTQAFDGNSLSRTHQLPLPAGTCAASLPIKVGANKTAGC